MRQLLVFASLLLTAAIGSAAAETAPTNEDHDVIVLKNGGIARGQVIEKAEGNYIVLKVSDDRAIKIGFDEIAFIADNNSFDSEGAPVLKPSRLYATGEYHFIATAGVLLGEKSTDYSISAMVGPQLNDNFLLAGGLQFDKHAVSMLSGRIHLFVLSDMSSGDDGFKELQLHVSLGYGQLVKDREETLRRGGSNVSFGVGWLFKLEDFRAVMLEIGWHHQSLVDREDLSAFGDFYTLSLGLRL